MIGEIMQFLKMKQVFLCTYDSSKQKTMFVFYTMASLYCKSWPCGLCPLSIVEGFLFVWMDSFVQFIVTYIVQNWDVRSALKYEWMQHLELLSHIHVQVESAIEFG